jgi:DNA-binding GntR family transcriptional regulator
VYITATPHGLEGEVDEHKPIIEAIAKGDGPGAQLAVQANWEAAADRLGQLVDRLGDRGSW